MVDFSGTGLATVETFCEGRAAGGSFRSLRDLPAAAFLLFAEMLFKAATGTCRRAGRWVLFLLWVTFRGPPAAARVMVLRMVNLGLAVSTACGDGGAPFNSEKRLLSASTLVMAGLTEALLLR